jgi:N-acetylmuramoyl-L-alanine amidase
MIFQKKLKILSFHCSKVIVFLFFILLSSTFDTVIAQDDSDLSSSYEDMRTRYRQLVIQDPSVTDLILWNKTRKEFQEFAFSETLKEDRVYAPRLWYLLGRLHEQMYVRGKDSSAGKEAEKVFKNIVESFPDDDLADDALLALSRMYHRQERFKEEKEALTTIIEEYAKSSSVIHAKKALEVLNFLGVLTDSDNETHLFEDEFTLQISEDRADSSVGSIRSLEMKYPVVVIDPGHGGSEDGAHGPEGIKEKEIVLTIANMVRTKFHGETKVRIFLTREVDEDLLLQDRTRIANELGADLFVSIHANASPYKTRKGVETYYLDNTDDKSSLRLAERENLVGNVPQKSLSFIISDFIQSIKMDDSITAAHLIQSSLVGALMKYYDNIKNLGVKKAPFYVLVGAHMPCILVEVSFIDHPVEGRRLNTERYQRVVADGIYDGVVAYLQKKGRLE